MISQNAELLAACERLERLGIHVLDVATTGLSAGLINRYLQIKQRGLI